MKRIRFKDYLIDYLESASLTETEFAKQIHITPKHLQEILSGKRDLSVSLVQNISLVTGISAPLIRKIEANYALEKKIDDYLKREGLTPAQYLNRLHYRCLLKNHVLLFKDPSNKMEIIKDILKFLGASCPEEVYEIDKNIRRW